MNAEITPDEPNDSAHQEKRPVRRLSIFATVLVSILAIGFAQATHFAAIDFILWGGLVAIAVYLGLWIWARSFLRHRFDLNKGK